MAWCDVVEPRTLRECRIVLGQSQAAFAAMLGVSPESYRTWDAGRRATPPHVMARARALATHRDEHALLPLPRPSAAGLAHGVHGRRARRGYSGVGLYSKLQPIRVDTSLGVPRFDREGRFMAGHFQTARGRFVVVNGYFPKGSGPDRDNSRVGYKLDFSRTVFARAQALRRRGPVLVIGDYNTAHRVIDLARPQGECHAQRVSPRGAGRTRSLDRRGLGGCLSRPASRGAWPVHVVAAVGRRARAEHRMADRPRLRIAGCDEAHTRGLDAAITAARAPSAIGPPDQQTIERLRSLDYLR